MPGSLNEAGASYPPVVGALFVFNLIVGTGALTMPKAFSAAGWSLSLVFIIALAFTSYLTVTFVIETMATANAFKRLKSADSCSTSSKDSDDERKPLLEGSAQSEINEAPVDVQSAFDIRDRIEMGQMAKMFLPRFGVYFFYGSIIIYLYGDLAIYAAAVPKSMRDVFCTYTLPVKNGTECGNRTLQDSDLCWAGTDISRANGYRIFLAVFSVCLGPFVFFNVQKTKYLQYFTTLLRWLAFSIMIVLALIRIASGKGEGKPRIAEPSGIPVLFGVCVYSFMCHHSLPSLVTPIRNKSSIYKLFSADYTLILVFYLLLSFTGIFAFNDIKDLYTLNFQPDPCSGGGETPITNIKFLQYFLALFPVFTLSTNYPIIGITLRNNLKTLFHRERKPYPWVVDRIVFPLLSLIPPLIIAFITDNLEILVGITGSYAGASIQYFIPAGLVFYSRRFLASEGGRCGSNNYTSPFKHPVWVLLIFIWAIACIVLVTVNHIIHGFN